MMTSLTFSSCTDKSAHDRTLYLRPDPRTGTWMLTVEYKNTEPDSLYAMEVDLDDIKALGRLLTAFAGAHDDD